MILNKVSPQHRQWQLKILQAQSKRRPVRRTVKREPDQKQSLILAAARQLFTTQGFSSTSTQQIARRAGVSEGIVFHHFGSKKNLLKRVAESFAAAAAAATMPANAEDMTEESVVRAAFDFADANASLYAMLDNAGTDVDAITGNVQNDVIVGTIAEHLQRGMARGEVRLTSPGILAELQFAVVDAAYRAWRRTNQPTLREDYILEAIECMQAMLRKN